MSLRILALVVASLPVLTGCGTFTPSLRDWPNTSDRLEKDMLQAIARTVGCELSHALTRAIVNDRGRPGLPPDRKTYSDYLMDWGAEVAINLTIIEKTEVNPTILLTPPSIPSSVFTLSGGIGASSEAQRLHKTNLFYRVKDLYKPAFFTSHEDIAKCWNPSGSKEGSLLVDTDLRLHTLIDSRIGITQLGIANSPDRAPLIKGENNVLSQTVSFRVITSGTLTPMWKLVRASVNPSGNLFSASRDRTHELVITLGPLDKSALNRASLVPVAEQAHQLQQLRTGIGNIIPVR